jgi:hypothetical protein
MRRKLHQDHFKGKMSLPWIERVEARLGRPEDQYDQYEEEEND